MVDIPSKREVVESVTGPDLRLQLPTPPSHLHPNYAIIACILRVSGGTRVYGLGEAN